jgi:uncharacterized protein (TIGR03435 family)
MRRVVLSAVIVALAGAGVLGQQPRPTFEVASVRPTNSTLPISPFAGLRFRVMPGGVFRATATVQVLIGFAHNLKDLQIVGGPEWIRRDGFEINAKAADPDTTADQIKAMLRTLIEERFALIAETQQRETQHHALVLLRSPDRLGPYLRHFEGDDCTPEAAKNARASFPPREAARIAGTASGNCQTMSDLTDMATMASGLPIIDATGLRGRIVFDLRYGPAVPIAPGSADEASLPPFAVALEEQLGLKLEQRKGPINVLVIESVQPPTEN